MTSPATVAIQEFEALRPFLFGIAYRMTGSAADAEDIVQEAWIRADRDTNAVRVSARAYLATIVSRLALDHLRSAKVKREHYVGPWLPEPIIANHAPSGIDPAALTDAKETLSMAIMVLLERLSPMERAVFVLHEAFDFRHAEIGDILDIEEATSRQHLRRARQRLAEGRQRYRCSKEQRAAVTGRFLEAVNSGEVSRVAALLAEDAVLIADGGGKVPSAMKPVYGRGAMARFFIGVRAKEPVDGIELVDINGELGIVTRHKRRLSVFAAEIGDDGLVHAVYAVRNPEKLPRVER